MVFSIGITTFKHRYKKYFCELIHGLKWRVNEDVETIVAINGEHKEKFDDEYRETILNNLSSYHNTFPIIFPQFRGLSKLWNSIVLTATSEYILLLNDDVTIDASNFLQHVEACIKQYQTSFKINGSWSHVVLKKSEVEYLNYFDERLLGIGEEDGDFEWRYMSRMCKPFLSVNIPGIINHVDMSHAPTNITPTDSGKYSKFNRELMRKIYIESEHGYRGMFDYNAAHTGMENQYPYEQFRVENQDKL